METNGQPSDLSVTFNEMFYCHDSTETFSKTTSIQRYYRSLTEMSESIDISDKVSKILKPHTKKKKKYQTILVKINEESFYMSKSLLVDHSLFFANFEDFKIDGDEDDVIECTLKPNDIHHSQTNNSLHIKWILAFLCYPSLKDEIYKITMKDAWSILEVADFLQVDRVLKIFENFFLFASEQVSDKMRYYDQNNYYEKKILCKNISKCIGCAYRFNLTKVKDWYKKFSRDADQTNPYIDAKTGKIDLSAYYGDHSARQNNSQVEKSKEKKYLLLRDITESLFLDEEHGAFQMDVEDRIEIMMYAMLPMPEETLVQDIPSK